MEENEWLSKTRSGGAYIPPARLAELQKNINDPQSEAFQRMTWEALKKSINGLINKVNTSNIKNIIPELFSEDLIRGRGLFARSIMKAQAASLPFTPVYAASVAVVNSKLPIVAELLLSRLIIQFRRGYRRNDKNQCLAVTMFIAHLVNQRVAPEILALQILLLLLERPTDDSVEIAVGFIRECGAALGEMSPKATHSVFERFRSILHEGEIDKRVQYMIEVLFQVRKEGFKDNQAVIEALDLVEEDDQITHNISLDDELDSQETLNIFRYDPKYLENEEKYRKIKAEILGEEEDEEEEEEEEDVEDEDERPAETNSTLMIQDRTHTNLTNLRKTIYLIIMSSLDFEETCHKLMKLNIAQGQEIELCNMILECCSQERTYTKFYGLLSERLSKINRIWSEKYEECFREIYSNIHLYEVNRVRNTAKCFAHLLATDGISWAVLDSIKLTEQDTTSASRIFVKFLFQELCEFLGLKKLKERLDDPFLVQYFAGLFPKDNARNIRFAINYFTSIGLGGLTDGMREFLMRKQQEEEEEEDSGSESSNSESDSSSSYESSVRSSPPRDPDGKPISNGVTLENRDKSDQRQHENGNRSDVESRDRRDSPIRRNRRDNRDRTPENYGRKSHENRQSSSRHQSDSYDRADEKITRYDERSPHDVERSSRYDEKNSRDVERNSRRLSPVSREMEYRDNSNSEKKNQDYDKERYAPTVKSSIQRSVALKRRRSVSP